MDRLDYYIEKQYGNDPKWFEEEIIQGSHAQRISNVIANRDYLSGRHKVLLRQDSQYKGKTLVVTHELTGLDGSPEYYCTEHYNELVDIVNSLYGD